MMQLRLGEVAADLQGVLQGADTRFTGICTDSRNVLRNSLFVALQGPNFDGHDYAPWALSEGAVAALVNRPLATGDPCLVVADTSTALGRLAGFWRDRFEPHCVGITGSNGKTTVKDMLAAILAFDAPVLANHGNLNNQIGVPLTLSRLSAEHRYLVVEMGANHRGEIASLARLAKPRIGIITLLAPAHLEGFGSLEAIAMAKGELLEALPQAGIAIVNADQPYQELWTSLAAGRTILRFGFSPQADVSVQAQLQAESSTLQFATPVGRFDATLHLAGRHNALNAAAAVCAALALSIKTEYIISGLESIMPIHGRLQPCPGIKGARILDDSYNANPLSLRAGLEVLASYPAPRCLVFADMLELGEGAENAHIEAGRLVRESGIEKLYATGPLSCATVAEFGANAQHFSDQSQLIMALEDQLEMNSTVLVKGSRSMHMENVVKALIGEQSCC